MKISAILVVVASCLVALAVADFYDDGYGSLSMGSYGFGSMGFGGSYMPMPYPTTGTGSQYPLLMLIGLLFLLMVLFGTNNNNNNNDQIILLNSTLEG